MTIKQVAKRARVSIATVSRTLHNSASVSPETAERVRRAIKDLDYRPDTSAQTLVSGRSRIFGLIISDIANPFFPEIVQVFERIAVQNHYEILLSSTNHDPKRMELAVRRMLERRVEGVAVLTFGMEEELIEHLHVRKVPVVFVDVGPPRPRVSNIRIDYLHGIRQAVQHLAALRHEKISFISGPLRLKSAVARQQAFLKSMQEIGLPAPANSIVEGDHTLEGGMRAFSNLAAQSERPTAVICSNDMTAIGVMRKSHESKVAIPGNLSVIGFDDIRLAQFMIPPLTTIQMSQSEIARLAFDALMADVQRESPAPNGTEYILRTNLVLRESTQLNSQRFSG